MNEETTEVKKETKNEIIARLNIARLNAEIEALKKELALSELSTDMYRKNASKAEGQIRELHSLFDSVEVPRKPDKETCSYCPDYTIMARFASYLQTMIMKHMELLAKTN
jgi:hypothetical protein